MKPSSQLKPVDPKTSFPRIEEQILDFWDKQNIFQKSLDQTKKGDKFVFLEGPPTANAKPGVHHVLARAFKDVFLRYKTMQGYYVERKAGWDTHGLPVELQVEKALGISGKPQIETLKKTKEGSIKFFNQKCQESVWQYKDEWENFTRRIGFWIDLHHPYVTYENTYIESLWWIIKQIWDRKLFYRGYKVVLHCPRCGTTLSSHEVAQGYKDITEPSVYVKFPLKNEKNTFILAWTTTPWTLPGNVALAVDKNIDYVKIELAKNHYKLILAQARLNILNEEYRVLETFKGEKLLNLKYTPLYDVKFEKKVHYLCDADFISTEDGTGIVHTAVMYGMEDYELGKKLGLPEKHTVDETGHFTKAAGRWAGKFVHDTNPEIIQDLKDRHLLYKTEDTTHSYPFCWRCDTKLIYYAKTTWYINMQRVQKELLDENQKINWVPEHIKDGRFGEWLRDVKDWAFARERYWGTPLPIWQCANPKCQEIECVGSITELTKKSLTKPLKLILIRHGEGEHNLDQIYSDRITDPYKLTTKGKNQIKKNAQDLKNEKIVKIISSDLIRCKETAEIIKKELKTAIQIEFDPRLREINFGKLYGQTVPAAGFKRKSYYFDRFPEGESIADVQKRIEPLLLELQKKYSGQTVLIISHENPLCAIMASAMKISKDFTDNFDIPTGSIHKIDLPPVLDLHKPYIDKIQIKCAKCGSAMQRVNEVCDVWFDSGSAPFAQWHYPFENQDKVTRSVAFPVDYISEAIDQTRGWFYTLLAVSVLLGKERPYKNVICLGHIRDKFGKKMSKSRGNMVHLEAIADKYGIDVLRWYFYTINQPGEYKNFDEGELDKNLKKNFLILWNIYGFLVTYSQAQNLKLEYQINPKPTELLDRWLYSKFNSEVTRITNCLNQYDVITAARSISDFINIFSTWYLRRSRKRLTMDTADAHQAMNYFYSILLDLCKLIAPFSPFLVENIYQNLRDADMPESIHLCAFPKANQILINQDLEKTMDLTREISSLALSLRAENGLKIRQPLAKLQIQNAKNITLTQDMLAIIQEEVNIVQIENVAEINSEFKSAKSATSTNLVIGLDINLTEDLQQQGQLNEIIRNIQALRKKAQCAPQDKIKINILGNNGHALDKKIRTLIIANQKKIIDKNNLKNLTLDEKITTSSIQSTNNIDQKTILTIELKK